MSSKQPTFEEHPSLRNHKPQIMRTDYAPACTSQEIVSRSNALHAFEELQEKRLLAAACEDVFA